MPRRKPLKATLRTVAALRDRVAAFCAGLGGVCITARAAYPDMRERAEITLEFADMDESPEGYFSGEHAESDVAWIRDQLRRGNDLAWCVAEVRATFAGFTGRDTLGACSYRNEADFRAGGYYDDMVTAAIEDLATEIESAVSRAKSQLTSERKRVAAALAALGLS